MELKTFFETFDNLEKTDKGYLFHCYIQNYYNDEFSPRKDEKLKILEIGVYMGASIKLWAKYFQNSEIVGLDIHDYFRHDMKNVKFIVCDAYEKSYVDTIPDNEYDYIIDDGPHSVESQLATIELWISKLKPNGKIAIEDIQSQENLEKLIDYCVKNNLIHKVFDYRKITGQYDDVVFEVTKK